MARGTLRVYLGAAPGVGKTYAMLNEGRRRHSRGTDVVVGFVETHGRTLTEAQIGPLEIVPRRTLTYRDATFEEMDVDAILARHPAQALVDELAHSNVAGSKHEKRWQDVEELLDAGIDVISTVNIQHLESVNDVVERITGVAQRETVPDSVVRAANQIELVDMSPEALRRRMAHGHIYDADRADAALANYFRPGNLAALRELALLWVADRVEDSLQQYMEDHGITEAWETRERVAVAITGAPGGETLIRRASRMAQRSKGQLLGVHVRANDGLVGPPPALLERHRELLQELGGTYREVVASDATAGLLSFARAEHATQLVLGHSRSSRWAHLTRGSVVNNVIRQAGDIDIHVISTRSEVAGTAGCRPPGAEPCSVSPGAASCSGGASPSSDCRCSPWCWPTCATTSAFPAPCCSTWPWSSVSPRPGAPGPASAQPSPPTCWPTGSSSPRCTPSPSATPTTSSPWPSSSRWPPWSAGWSATAPGGPPRRPGAGPRRPPSCGWPGRC